MTEERILGISTCLTGKNVRYNGGNKLNTFIIDTLTPHVRFLPVCPEAEAGFGVPREPVTLVGTPDSPRVVTKHTNIDITDTLMAWTQNCLDRLEKEHLSGFIFKSKSPSCEIPGKTDTVSFPVNEIALFQGGGIFARAFMKRFPHLPVIDEKQFQDPKLRGHFLKAIGVQAP